MAPSFLILLFVLCVRDTSADGESCRAYENRTAQIGRTRGLKAATVTEEVLVLELRDCRLDLPLMGFPPHADYVILTNVTFGTDISWPDVLPSEIAKELRIEDSKFEDERILRKLFVNNIGVLSILRSGLSVLPVFNATSECLTRKANFSGNSIGTVTEEAFNVLYARCKFLEDLDLTRNSIRKFPKFAAQNVSKCKLHLENNPLSCTDNDHLTLNQRTRDMLIRTPHCEKDGKLVQFWFHDSPICARCSCYIHSDIYVNCSGRGLDSLPAGLPRETTHLDVSVNQLTSLRIPEESHWREYNAIKHLNASHNPITSIDDYSPHICNLMMLDVSSASLTALPQSLVDELLNTSRCVPLLSVGRLLLGHNPWRCDCDLLPFKRFLGERAREIVDFFTVQCDKRGEEVYTVQEETLCPPPFYELNPWDVAIVTMTILITLMIYKTIRDYYIQKHTGKLPKFFKVRLHAIKSRDFRDKN
ncbi:carboxypeptidase N subunit 2 [Galendromus occidentalis]|uniref:Carboxypeptidase N subunit 2 n=1 Tax=Galendromus occidentalis TaxID=34638 RepID=A0AAJ6VVI2_9ACAR|nr:carboxypeptidase N subunit 2 [Galendromus occidentalis]